jgi:hypothetical protein
MRQQQLLGGQVPAADVSDDSNDEAPYTTMLQPQQQRPGLPRPPSAAQQAAKRPASRMQRPVMTAAQQQQQQQQQVQMQQQMQQARQFTRVVTAYNPHMYQHQQMQAQAHAHAQQQYQQQQYQQQVQAQQQAHAHLQAQQQQQMQQQQQPQQMMAMMQQLMMQLQGNTQAGPNTAVPAEMTELWFKIGSSLGAMMQEKGGPAVLTNPQAMCSIVEAVLKQTTGDPDAAMQQLAATMAAAGTAM